MGKKIKRLKETISSLRQDITILIEKPDSIEAMEVKFRHQMRRELTILIMKGRSYGKIPYHLIYSSTKT
jgi:hypothetical protein